MVGPRVFYPVFLFPRILNVVVCSHRHTPNDCPLKNIHHHLDSQKNMRAILRAFKRRRKALLGYRHVLEAKMQRHVTYA